MAKKVKTIVGVKPTLSQILVERLNAAEVMGTILTVNDNSDYGAPQGYVLALGPSVKADECGIHVGDRVLITGTYVPVPNFDGSARERGLLELHNIKAVLVEDE